MSKIEVEDFHVPDTVYQIGLPPNRIDILTSITAIDIEDAWQRRKLSQIEAISVNVLSRSDLIVNKRAAGRPKDIADAIWLEDDKRTSSS